MNCPDSQVRKAKTLPQVCLKPVLLVSGANFMTKIERIFCKKQENSRKNCLFSKKGKKKTMLCVLQKFGKSFQKVKTRREKLLSCHDNIFSCLDNIFSRQDNIFSRREKSFFFVFRLFWRRNLARCRKKKFFWRRENEGCRRETQICVLHIGRSGE